MASWLVRSPPDRAVWGRAWNNSLAGNTLLCSWARHFSLTVPLSTQVYKRVQANLMLGVARRWTNIPSEGSRNIPSCFMLQKPEISASIVATWLACRLIFYKVEVGYTTVQSPVHRYKITRESKALGTTVLLLNHKCV